MKKIVSVLYVPGSTLGYHFFIFLLKIFEVQCFRCLQVFAYVKRIPQSHLWFNTSLPPGGHRVSLIYMTPSPPWICILVQISTSIVRIGTHHLKTPVILTKKLGATCTVCQSTRKFTISMQKWSYSSSVKIKACLEWFQGVSHQSRLTANFSRMSQGCLKKHLSDFVHTLSFVMESRFSH